MISYAPMRAAPGCHHGRSVSTEVSLAAHEAAHALVWHEHGRSIDRVTVKQAIEDGVTVHGQVTGGQAVLYDDADYWRRLIQCVAGHAGEMAYQGESIGLRGSDKRRAHMCAEELAESGRARKKLISAAIAEAGDILERHWLAFERIINALLERRTLTGAEVTEIIKRSTPRT